MIHQSPDYVKTSLAGAMTLGFKPGWFYRNAKLGCINLLQIYPDGCRANCSYCGLSRMRPGDYDKKSFIRVDWPVLPLDEILLQMREKKDRIHRICLSMITHPRAASDSVEIVRRIRSVVDTPISVLVSPTCIDGTILYDLHSCGADRCGIAIDAATPELFDQHRGKSAGGPHTWKHYWTCLEQAVRIFGRFQANVHWISGLGETERQLAKAIWKTHEAGAVTDLFSFFPEPGSRLSDRMPPAMETYRRMQLVRYLIDTNIAKYDDLIWYPDDRLKSIKIPKESLDRIVSSGMPFQTSGCPGPDGSTACNRPYANSLPGPDIRNYPFLPGKDDLLKIRSELILR